jgi:uncharacterized protein (TIGR02444 family)
VQRLADLSTSRFWAFSLELYEDNAVAEACIALQDRHGLDVNMLLFALFAASRGTSLSGADIEQLEMMVGPWRRNVVRPLRRVRRWLKEQSHAADDAPAKLRSGVLDRELESEAYQQEVMEHTVRIDDGAPDVRAAQDNLARYAQFAGLAVDDELRARFATLVERFSACAATGATSGTAARRD